MRNFSLAMVGRRLKSLTALWAVAIAVGGGATAAQAEPFFEADSYTATVDGSAAKQTVFAFHPGASPYKWECLKVAMQGKLTTASTSLALTPVYAECRWQYPVTEPPQPFSAVTMNMNGCNWKLHALSKIKAGEFKSLADLECPAGKIVVIELREALFTICTLTLGSQSSKSQVRLIDQANKEGSADDSVEALIEISNLVYIMDATGKCPVGSGTYEDLTYTGVESLTATSEAGKQIGLRVAGE